MDAGWKGGWIDGCWVDREWMDGWMDEWNIGWMGGWNVRWMMPNVWQATTCG